jgi:hypothetical protein
MDRDLMIRKSTLCTALAQELERWNRLTTENLDKRNIETSRRTIMGYCDELEQIERLEGRAA